MKRILCLLAMLTLAGALQAETTFRVGAYNVENYLDVENEGRPAKTAAAKAKVVEFIKALQADILSVEEMGDTNSFLGLRAELKKAGVDYPHWEHITGHDPAIHVALLSKFPIVARRPHTNDTFLLNGKKFSVSRGFLEVDIQVNPQTTVTVLAAHLKSKRPVPEADQAEWRLEEAKVLREKIDARLQASPNGKLIVLGDFNDTFDTKPVKAIVGKGQTGLVDLRPVEQNGDTVPSPVPYFQPRRIAWTHYYGKEDSYSRIDYILVSRNFAKQVLREKTYVLAAPNWGEASDHRPVVATFLAE